MQLRKANIQDVDAVRFLFYDSITTVNAKDYSLQQIEVWGSGFKNIESWKKKIEEQYFLLAEVEGVVAGFASLTNEGYLDFIYVHKDFQGTGIAKTLLAALEKRANELQLKVITTIQALRPNRFLKRMDLQ